jgi:secreted Zn-dependent insulinase-like peptidase
MNLVLVSRFPLDDLQKFAEENFSEVENRNIEPVSFADEVVFD